MYKNAFTGLDTRKWFDRMFPQTLAVASWLLYIDGAFAVINYVDRRDHIGDLRMLGGIFQVFAIISCLSYIAGAYLMANGKLLGWYVSIFAAVTPLIGRFLIASKAPDYGFSIDLKTRLMGSDTIGFLFEAALFVLLVHPMSRTHARRWFR